MSDPPTSTRARRTGLVAPDARCAPFATPGFPVGVIPSLSDVEEQPLICEDAQVLLYAQWEGLLPPAAQATTSAHPTRTEHLNDKRRTS